MGLCVSYSFTVCLAGGFLKLIFITGFQMQEAQLLPAFNLRLFYTSIALSLFSLGVLHVCLGDCDFLLISL